MELDPLSAICPTDGRYHSKTKALAPYFSEFGLIKYRVLIEARYFEALCRLNLKGLQNVPNDQVNSLVSRALAFTQEDATRIKEIEKTTNHDVKAVEYFLKECADACGLESWKEFIHFGLTSQDVNNSAVPLSIKDALHEVYLPMLDSTVKQLSELANQWKDVPLLARTHGQPASPTRLGKEMLVFVERLQNQIAELKSIPITAKFGGATGNFNAHFTAYPQENWVSFANTFMEGMGLKRQQTTTQIEHYDYLAGLLQTMSRIHVIFIDLCRDIWTYVSMDYFKQKVVAGEIGSSAMPHKVNPIDFENAEGNLGLANAISNHLAGKLPISRLQRDLTDSTVLRNIGMPFSYGLIALTSIQKGLNKLVLNEEKIKADLENNWMVVAEGIQTVLRREGYPNPYEELKALTRGKAHVGENEIQAFIDALSVGDDIKEELKKIRPETYLGV